jgi:dTMP kinase
MSKKPIIVFEDIEGTGKSHHINNVAKYLKKIKSLFKSENLVEVKIQKK